MRGDIEITRFHHLIITDAERIEYQDSQFMISIERVMDDFYHAIEPSFRPRVFALANQPTDCKFHFGSSMLKLEYILDAKVFGVSSEKRSEILALPDRPTEAVVLYDIPPRISDTKLFKQLHQLDPSGALLRCYFKAARYTLTEVGACASDLVWRRALKEIEASMPPSYEEDDDIHGYSEGKVVKARSSIRDVIKNWMFTMPNLDTSSRGFNVTPKFSRLVQILRSCEPYGGAFRGIVFGQLLREVFISGHINLYYTVQRRVIALAIADLLRNLDDHIGFLRPHAFFRQGSSTDFEIQVRPLKF